MKREHPDRVMDAGVGVGVGDDEQLAVLGYNVRASKMADVAHKMEQIEAALGTAASLFHGEDGLFSHLASDAVYFNPSDISTCLETMLSELKPDGGDGAGGGDCYDGGDISAIPGRVLCKQSSSNSSAPAGKRQRTAGEGEEELGVATPAAAAGTKTVVLVDAQEMGIRLVHTLMACAEAVQQDQLTAADQLVNQVSYLAAGQAGPMRKVATYFAEALSRRIFYSRSYPAKSRTASVADEIDPSVTEMLEMNFYEASPCLKFAHFTANQAILEAVAGKSRVHVIDFGIKQGMQWPALMQALAVRAGGPPVFRLTAIGPPQPDERDVLQEVGFRLANFADAVGVKFDYRGLVAASLADLEPYMLQVRPGEEAVAVNSVMELHRLLARPGSAEKVLATVSAMAPDVFTVVEQEADHNSPVFLDRFTEALHYYSSMFDSLESGGGGGGGNVAAGGEELVMAEMYVGRQIGNVVACEGAERVERHETTARWRGRMEAAGFAGVHLGSNAFKQASMLLAVFAGGDGYRVEEKNGCLMLGWHTRPLISTSAWRVADR